MKLWDCFSTALRALLGNKLRSILTMLGILIGVAAVISVLSLGSAQAAIVEESFATLGSNLIYVTPPELGISGVGSQSTLTLEDAQAIAQNAPSVKNVAPMAQTYAQIVAGGESLSNTIIAGVWPEAEVGGQLCRGTGQLHNQIRLWSEVKGSRPGERSSQDPFWRD